MTRRTARTHHAGTGGRPSEGAFRAGFSSWARLVRSLLGLATVAATASCAGGRAPGPDPAAEANPVPRLAGLYRGVFEVEGEPWGAEARIGQEGSRLEATLSSEDGLEARGHGTVKDGRSVRIELAYGSSCSGTVDLEGTIAAEGRRLSGRFRARDCTGSVEGSFHLDRLSDP